VDDFRRQRRTLPDPMIRRVRQKRSSVIWMKKVKETLEELPLTRRDESRRSRDECLRHDLTGSLLVIDFGSIS
jgi:hypothetical protein